MSTIDLQEIPSPNKSGYTRDLFELFAQDFLAASGYRILEGPARGPDGGKDLIVSEPIQGVVSRGEIRWLVSVKHLAHTGRAVGVNDELNILERVGQVRADGFLGFYSTVPSTGLQERLNGLALQLRSEIYGPSRITGDLLSNPALRHVYRQYLPKSFASLQVGQPTVRFRLFTEVGESFDRDEVELDLSSMLESTDGGVLRIADPELEDIVTACVLANALRRGKFSVLQRFISFRPLVWRHLTMLVAKSGLNGAALEVEISTTTNSAYLRLLISIAGEVRCEEAVEAICKRLLIDGRLHHKVIGAFGVPITPFYDVVKTALALQDPSTCELVERYIGVARTRRLWPEKRVLEAALRKLQKPQNPAAQPDGDAAG